MSDNSILAELVWEPERGALTFKGVRYLLIRPETLIGLQKAMEAEVGPGRTAEVLYQGGFTGGRLSGEKYRDTFGLDERGAVEYMCRMGGEIGWGALRLVDLDLAAGRMVVEAEASPFAEAYGEARQGVCHLLRGVFGGLGEALFGRPVEAVEETCRAAGADRCRIRVAARPEAPG